MTQHIHKFDEIWNGKWSDVGYSEVVQHVCHGYTFFQMRLILVLKIPYLKLYKKPQYYLILNTLQETPILIQSIKYTSL